MTTKAFGLNLLCESIERYFFELTDRYAHKFCHAVPNTGGNKAPSNTKGLKKTNYLASRSSFTSFSNVLSDDDLLAAWSKLATENAHDEMSDSTQKMSGSAMGKFEENWVGFVSPMNCCQDCRKLF